MSLNEMNNTAKEIHTELSFREIVADDLPRILELNHDLHEGEEIPDIDSRITSIWEQMLGDSRLHCFVAELDSVAKRRHLELLRLDFVEDLAGGQLEGLSHVGVVFG